MSLLCWVPCLVPPKTFSLSKVQSETMEFQIECLPLVEIAIVTIIFQLNLVLVVHFDFTLQLLIPLVYKDTPYYYFMVILFTLRTYVDVAYLLMT